MSNRPSLSLGQAYTICRAHGFEIIRATPRAVVVRGYPQEWPLIGFLRLAEALLKERYRP